MLNGTDDQGVCKDLTPVRIKIGKSEYTREREETVQACARGQGTAGSPAQLGVCAPCDPAERNALVFPRRHEKDVHRSTVSTCP